MAVEWYVDLSTGSCKLVHSEQRTISQSCSRRKKIVKRSANSSDFILSRLDAVIKPANSLGIHEVKCVGG